MGVFLITTLILACIAPFAVIAIALEMKLDWTHDRKLLLWYTHYEEIEDSENPFASERKRKFKVLLNFNS